MDPKKLAQILSGTGGIITFIAFFWWLSFFGGSGDTFSCLFTSGGACGFVSGLAQLGGKTPYNPVVFWIGIIMLGSGIIVSFSLKDENTPASEEVTGTAETSSQNINQKLYNSGKCPGCKSEISNNSVRCTSCQTSLIDYAQEAYRSKR